MHIIKQWSEDEDSDDGEKRQKKIDSGSDTSDTEDDKTPKPVNNKKKKSVTKRVKYTIK